MSKATKTPDSDPFKDPRLVVQELGVWTLLKERTGRLEHIHPRAAIDQLKDAYSPYARLVGDTIRLEPVYLSIYILYRVWISVEPVILLYFTSSILNAIEFSLKSRSPNITAIGQAAASYLMCVTLTSGLKSLDTKVSSRLQSSITAYFEEKFLYSGLNRDLPSSLDHVSYDSFSHVDGNQAWRTLSSVAGYIGSFITALSHVLFVSRSPTLASSNFLFAVICLLHPLAETFLTQSFWQQDMVFFASNKTYTRMKALQRLTDQEFKKDVLSGDISEYVMSEHSNAREALRGTPMVSPWELESQRSAYSDILLGILSGLPILYYAAQAVFYPAEFSMTTVAVLQQSHTALRSMFSSLVSSASWIRREVGSLKHFYRVLDRPNTILDGEKPYPTSSEKSRGMGLELRNVSFGYPSSRSNSDALNDVSVFIEPGSLVVVVGANGSGKSTLVNILTRLYDVTAGTVLVDSHPIQEYCLSDLRKATAVLTQDHELFPLSVHENIGMGNTTLIGNKERVMESAKQGGGTEIISKFREGMDTVLVPFNDLCALISPGVTEDHPLNKACRALDKKVEVSGGEKQRLVASRMFMRFTSDNIRLVCVDEPSSALDPEAEFKLFNNLRQVREGKTMIFITHRFGHLARYADLILYMKDGKIAERGTHEQLMKENGGYAHQYNIQASAFQAVSS